MKSEKEGQLNGRSCYWPLPLMQEKLIELAGRTCYLSHDRSKPGSEQRFIRMLLRHEHLSVLEHAYATFRIKGGSRAFTHQIVRHRLASLSQQSQRYVSEGEL